MNRRRKRTNWFNIILLSLLVLGGAYFNRYILPNQASPFVPTPTPTRPPESYITEAQDYFKQGKLTQSISSYQQAIAVQPNNPATYIALAQVQVWAGQYKDAQTSAESALLLNKDNSMANAVRAWALDFEGDYPNALDSIKTALTLDDKNGLAHAYYVEILIDAYLSGTGPLDAINTAIEESRVAQTLLPDDLETHRARGYLLEATSNYTEAVQEYQAAININPNIADLHMALGRNYRALGIYDQAITEFTKADALNPADPLPDLYISRTYATVGEYGKAAQYAETAVKNSPADASLRGNLGVMYYREGLWPDAIQQLSLVINGGQSDDGRAIKAIPLVPNDVYVAEYYFTYGLALAHLNRCGEALKIAQMISDRIPSDDTAVANANAAVTICRNNLKASPTPPDETATPAATAEATETPPSIFLTPTPASSTQTQP